MYISINGGIGEICNERHRTCHFSISLQDSVWINGSGRKELQANKIHGKSKIHTTYICNGQNTS